MRVNDVNDLLQPIQQIYKTNLRCTIFLDMALHPFLSVNTVNAQNTLPKEKRNDFLAVGYKARLGRINGSLAVQS